MATPQSVDPHCPECGSLLEYRLDTQDYYCKKCKAVFVPVWIKGELGWSSTDDEEVEGGYSAAELDEEDMDACMHVDT